MLESVDGLLTADWSIQPFLPYSNAKFGVAVALSVSIRQTS